MTGKKKNSTRNKRQDACRAFAKESTPNLENNEESNTKDGSPSMENARDMMSIGPRIRDKKDEVNIIVEEITGPHPAEAYTGEIDAVGSSEDHYRLSNGGDLKGIAEHVEDQADTTGNRVGEHRFNCNQQRVSIEDIGTATVQLLQPTPKDSFSDSKQPTPLEFSAPLNTKPGHSDRATRASPPNTLPVPELKITASTPGTSRDSSPSPPVDTAGPRRSPRRTESVQNPNRLSPPRPSIPQHKRHGLIFPLGLYVEQVDHDDDDDDEEEPLSVVRDRLRRSQPLPSLRSQQASGIAYYASRPALRQAPGSLSRTLSLNLHSGLSYRPKDGDEPSTYVEYLSMKEADDAKRKGQTQDVDQMKYHATRGKQNEKEQQSQKHKVRHAGGVAMRLCKWLGGCVHLGRNSY
jgi:hypothetical protein